jgi:hypothetical protein
MQLPLELAPHILERMASVALIVRGAHGEVLHLMLSMGVRARVQ